MEKFGFGQPVPRTEDPRLLTGRGLYVDDVRMPAMTHAVFVGSPPTPGSVRSAPNAPRRRPVSSWC